MALRRLQDEHISSQIIGQNPPVNRILKTKRNNIEATQYPVLEPYLRAAGFWTVAQIGGYKIDSALCGALIERWRPETHTFHLPWGECTVTLEDVAMILGLRVDGKAVTGHSSNFVIDGEAYEMADYIQMLLGVRPSGRDVAGSTLSMAFLHRHFSVLPAGVDDAGLIRFARGYIMRLIGGLLCPNKTGAEVHICFLSLLVDLPASGKYSWGSAVLTVLYRYLCKATAPDAAQMGGCLLLLQVWAWYRVPFFRPGEPDLHAHSFPLACRWTRLHSRHISSVEMLNRYREQLDMMDVHSFVWRPYIHCEAVIPLLLRIGDPIWRSCTAVICFDTVEWHHADRVLQQFGYHQHIPQAPTQMDAIHAVDMRGKQDTKWHNYHRVWVRLWKSRHTRIAGDVPYEPGDLHVASEGYYRWYWQETSEHLFMTGFRMQGMPTLHYPAGVFGITYDVPVPPTQTGRRKKRTDDNLPSESEEDVPEEWALRFRQEEEHHGGGDAHADFYPDWQPDMSVPYTAPYYPEQATPVSYAQPSFGYGQTSQQPMPPYYGSDAQQYTFPSASPFRTPPPQQQQNLEEPDVDLDSVQWTFTPLDAWPAAQPDTYVTSPLYDRFVAVLTSAMSTAPLCRNLHFDLDASSSRPNAGSFVPSTSTSHDDVTLSLGLRGDVREGNGGRGCRHRRPPSRPCPACPDS